MTPEQKQLVDYCREQSKSIGTWGYMTVSDLVAIIDQQTVENEKLNTRLVDEMWKND